MNERSVGEILVVDDTPDNLKLLAALLLEQGYRVRPASSGAMALRSAAARAPDLILLDVRMPDLDGYAVCRKLKADPALRGVPVIFISALDEAADKVEGFAAGGVDYLTKPFETAEVLARLRIHLNLAWLQRRQEETQRELEGRVAERTAELAEANRALRESEERLRLVFEATSDGVWDWNLRTQQVFFSDRWYSMLGYAPGEFASSYEAWRDRVHPDDLVLAEKALQDHLEGRAVEYRAEFRMRNRVGEWLWIQARGKVVERDMAGTPQRIVGTHVDIGERKRSQRLIETALREKEVLLKEVYHRVKNNLQVISSLLNMQAREANDKSPRALLLESANRVDTMAMVHEQLYQSGDLSQVRYDHYVEQLAQSLMQTNEPFSRRISVRVEAQPVLLGIETAIPLGLIINELLSNAYKHAFPADAAGEIVVRLAVVGEQLCLSVCDNGKGLPAGYAIGANSSLGMRLVESLAVQLDAGLSVESGQGTCFHLAMPFVAATARLGRLGAVALA